jgi:hypothetical protein
MARDVDAAGDPGFALICDVPEDPVERADPPWPADHAQVKPDRQHLGRVRSFAAAILPGPRVYDTLHVLDLGPGYHAGDTSGVITSEPPAVGAARCGVLVPQVDADGNDLGGVSSVFLQVPIGTYTGWNTGRKDRFENGFCSLQGSFIPFAVTRAEREAGVACRIGASEPMFALLRAIDAMLPHAEPNAGEFLGDGGEGHLGHLFAEQREGFLRVGQ